MTALWTAKGGNGITAAVDSELWTLQSSNCTSGVQWRSLCNAIDIPVGQNTHSFIFSGRAVRFAKRVDYLDCPLLVMPAVVNNCLGLFIHTCPAASSTAT